MGLVTLTKSQMIKVHASLLYKAPILSPEPDQFLARYIHKYTT
uniref:Uncharacterized protein n=1 Tax=Arundo donax TaxID=35708 RepID=A0A0A9BRM5_ARUDO